MDAPSMNHKYIFFAPAVVLGLPVPLMAQYNNAPQYNAEGGLVNAKPLVVDAGKLSSKRYVQPVQQVIKAEGKSSLFQVKTGFGWSDNVNRGVRFDSLKLGVEGVQVTLPLSQQSKAQEGTWTDAEVLYRNVLPPKTGLDGSFQLGGALRDYHADHRLDFGVVSAQATVGIKGVSQALDPQVVVSGSSISLGGADYQKNMGLGVQLQPKIQGKSLTVRYSFNNSDYQKIENSDGNYHKLNLTVPVALAKKNATLDVDAGYQWPGSTEQLLDYREASLKLRLRVTVTPKQVFSSSYSISKQVDHLPYGGVFGDQKRDLQQQEVAIGWEWNEGKHLTYEGKLKTSKTNSGIKLFENSATDATVDVLWKMN
jgi:hypothetical protein